MIICNGCFQKTYGTLRAKAFRMCEACIEEAGKEIEGLKAPRTLCLLPVLFYEDLKLIKERMGGTKNLCLMLNVAPVTINTKLKIHKGRERLPRFLVRAVYRPLWGTWAKDWLDILPTRVFLVAASARRRTFRTPSSRAVLSMRPELCSPPPITPNG